VEEEGDARLPELDLPHHAGAAPLGGDGMSRGRLRRSLPLATLTARTAGEAAVVGLHSRLTGADTTEFHIRTAERYAELLGRSRGALMKAGQMLSIVSANPVVPSEYQSIYQQALARLRNEAPPMAPELARTVLERELGGRVQNIFAHFDWTPLAAASIGQVHAAQLHDGRPVAVKIQYPGAAEAIRSDLKNNELIATLLGLITSLSSAQTSFDMRGAAHEMSMRITEELDYRLEAANQAQFANTFRGHPFIHVPEVIEELCTSRVLTQELVQGKSWSEAVTGRQELRNSWAEVIYRFIYTPSHRFRLFHADPHPGNYLFHDDGTVSFLDFGCVKRFGAEIAETMYAVGRACIRNNVRETWRASIEGGLWRSSDPVTPEEVFEYWRGSWELWWAPQPFTVTPEYVARWLERRYSPTGPSANAFRYLSASPEYTFLGRIEIAELSLVAELRPSSYWGSMAAECFEDATPLTALGKLDRAFFSGYRP
jgi:predicted unusual protein kinase regulating ubiquinone biosynthesis (AarF/ABC1/UbiB family)